MSDDEPRKDWAPRYEQVPEADWLPTTPRDQNCAICRDTSVTWLHPLAGNLVGFRAYNSGYTLPTFWTLCDSCESLYQAGEDDEMLKRMQQPDGEGGTWNELAQKSLATFRRADLGARLFDDDEPQVT